MGVVRWKPKAEHPQPR